MISLQSSNGPRFWWEQEWFGPALGFLLRVYLQHQQLPAWCCCKACWETAMGTVQCEAHRGETSWTLETEICRKPESAEFRLNMDQTFMFDSWMMKNQSLTRMHVWAPDCSAALTRFCLRYQSKHRAEDRAALKTGNGSQLVRKFSVSQGRWEIIIQGFSLLAFNNLTLLRPRKTEKTQSLKTISDIF